MIIICDGMPSIPRKQALAEFLSKKGYWVIYPRYRGTWESDGVFLKRSPHLDLLDVIDELPKGLTDLTFGKKFRLVPYEIFVIGGSFGGTAAILSTLDPRVNKAVANCPVVDWSILARAEKAETSNRSYASYVRQAFGNAYRFTPREWRKLKTGTFYSPIHHAREIDPHKLLIFHAKDDPYVPWQTVNRFARKTGARLKMSVRGGHLNTAQTVPKYWRQIETFFRGK